MKAPILPARKRGPLTRVHAPIIVTGAMKILVIGSGGREHALAWRLRRSSSVEQVWCAPGNAGIAQDAQCVAADTANTTGLADLAQRLGADLTVVGPEQPLVLGIADEFSRRGLRLVGPSQQCAQLEGSKVFAKRFLERHHIPTARMYAICESTGDAYRALDSVEWPVVMKADGLCGGKGVLVTGSRDEARVFVESVMERRTLGDGGKNMLLEEALRGQELSLIVLADGKRFVPLVPARDHKRALDHDQGPNTGGMGAYSTESIISAELERQILDTIVRPTFNGLAADGLTYQGFLYFGLMLTPEGPRVLEFNCRLGDPETQAIVARMDFDLAEALAATAEGALDKVRFTWRPGASLCVVMTSGGYPGSYDVGKRIEGLAEAAKIPDAIVFHAATETREEHYYTCSGRVLGVTATGANLEAARRAAYQAVCKIRFDGQHYRHDIGLAATKASGVTGD
jgi:phosphoribosylamine--glycine ligase